MFIESLPPPAASSPGARLVHGRRRRRPRRQPLGSSVAPVCDPATLSTYDRATVAAGRPCAGSIPSARNVSVTQGGLTTLTRMPLGASSAAARAKPSTPALTRLTAAEPDIAVLASTPEVSVKEPPSRTLG